MGIWGKGESSFVLQLAGQARLSPGARGGASSHGHREASVRESAQLAGATHPPGALLVQENGEGPPSPGAYGQEDLSEDLGDWREEAGAPLLILKAPWCKFLGVALMPPGKLTYNLPLWPLWRPSAGLTFQWHQEPSEHWLMAGSHKPEVLQKLGLPTSPVPRPSADEGTAACRTLEVGSGDARRGPRARGEHRRRHTITNGADCGLLQQAAELEQEEEVLLRGLEMMAQGRDWYQQQLRRVQERRHRLAQGRTSTDLEAAGSPRPLGCLLPKVQEVARCLGELLAAACTGTALPSASVGPQCPAPAPGPPSAPGWQHQTVLMLKEHNRLLTQEVTAKSARIAQLQREKATLIQQLFEARALSQQDAGARIAQLQREKATLIQQLFEARALSQQDAGPLDSTFI
ncbi:suppressor APC domain-containing protein 2 [Tupaia chinensis]|uniref:suppressor APC domain-containing protein 2 n=1 Tax=Tupaia chinensis TaxID=246437 RepID=UPI000FFC9A84|nr:suppressor APC domain-containing protein 2 [Tupaia chinensis]